MLFHRNHCIAVIIIWILSFLAITKINATEAHMFEHYMIQVCLKYCKMINECLLGKFIFKKIEYCFLGVFLKGEGWVLNLLNKTLIFLRRGLRKLGTLPNVLFFEHFFLVYARSELFVIQRRFNFSMGCERIQNIYLIKCNKETQEVNMSLFFFTRSWTKKVQMVLANQQLEER